MKRIAAFFLLCLLLLCACQPIPTSEVVTPKDFDALLQKAQASHETVHVTLMPEMAPAIVRESLPDDLFRMEFYGNADSFHVVVNARMAQPDNNDGRLLVPVWSFYGALLCITSDQAFNHAHNPSLPFLPLNAVDGNLIDLMKGY